MLCEHGDRRVARMDAPLDKPKAKFVPLADSYEGKRLNSPNDLVYIPDGDLYFTDPPYGLTEVDDPGKELDFHGVYRVCDGRQGDAADQGNDAAQRHRLFARSRRRCTSPTPTRSAPIWMAFTSRPTARSAKGRVFFDATSWVGQEQKGCPTA